MEFDFEDGVRMVQSLTQSVMSIVDSLKDDNASLQSITTRTSEAVHTQGLLLEEPPHVSNTDNDVGHMALLASSASRQLHRKFHQNQFKKDSGAVEVFSLGRLKVLKKADDAGKLHPTTTKMDTKMTSSIDTSLPSALQLNFAKDKLFSSTFPPAIQQTQKTSEETQIGKARGFGSFLNYNGFLKPLRLNINLDNSVRFQRDPSHEIDSFFKEFENDLNFLSKAPNRMSTPEHALHMSGSPDQSRGVSDSSGHSRPLDSRLETRSLVNKPTSARRLFFKSENEEAVYYLVTKYLNKDWN